jgi:DNA polymerase-3 subunit epsilon
MTLVHLLGLPKSGRAHRAMVDAEMTSHLWCRMQQDVAKTYGIESVSHALLARAQKLPRLKMPTFLHACTGAAG